MNPKERMKAALKAAKDIAEKANGENRSMTQAEAAAAAGHLKEFDAAKQDLEDTSGFGAKKSEETLAALKSIGLELGFGGSTPPSRTFITKASQRWADSVISKIKDRAPSGAKALIGGTLNIASVIEERPVLIDGEPTRVLDLIPRRPNDPVDGLQQGVGNTFSWLRQTVRDLNAAGIPDGAQKPTSGITFDDVEDRFHTYAHLTEPMPKRYLDDYRMLIEILREQLGEGLMEGIEYDVLNGSGTVTAEVVEDDPEEPLFGQVTTPGRDPFRGILNTSGIQVQAYATSVLNTLSAARYKLTDSQETPNAWVMNSADVRALEMMTETGTGAFLFGSGRSTLRQVLGDYPIVTTSLMAAGSALLGDFTKTELVVREDDHIDVDGSGVLFDRNQVKFRSEGRYGFAVLKPHAFVTVDLTA